ncbi:DUF6879 family protein [Streptomyces hoynatensis]|uniref:DUF6879 domain-containing protein n=1 Tax=Streptomyces hoynatensis TaxID=1141874 RepID=A0A3A9YU82_9ACTN|nr:DUF6879 family protein [Streptomyces hoynatensis]RKN39500.1 hypothetical protein D7294_21135 [Streptomyces hoynatensis]
MREVTPPSLAAARGERLELAEYRADFRRHRGELRGQDSWKLERRQHFVEQSDSWRAFRRGHWQEALARLDEDRPALLAATRRDRERNTAFHRVRVVEQPLTPYLQWELHALRVQAECGKPIRVVGPAEAAPLEAARPLPELAVLGDRVLYEIVYTPEGALDGGVRFTDPELIEDWRALIQRLYAAGEDLLPFFARDVAHLPPPHTETGD